MQRPPYKTWAIHHLTSAPISSLIHSDWPSEEDWNGTEQKERERISKIIRRENRKVAEEEKRKNAEERTLSSRSCVPDLLGDEPNLPLTNPSAPALEERERPHEKQNDQVTDYYAPSPIYIAGYEEEDASNLVDNLIPKPTESDWDSDYSCSY